MVLEGDSVAVNVGKGTGVSVKVGDGTSVSVGNGEGDGEGVRVGGSTYVLVGVNVAVIVGVRETVAEIAGSVKVGVNEPSFVPSGVRVTVGVFCPRSRLVFHNNIIPKQ